MKKAFTLAEVLITLAIIGVVAAISIPSVISNSQQQEFKTGLRKAVSVLNSAITMNMAIDGESPYDNGDLFNYLQRHMSVLKSATKLPFQYTTLRSNGTRGAYGANAGFYTTDGMRFEMDDLASENNSGGPILHESGLKACMAGLTNMKTSNGASYNGCGGCGSLGLSTNSNNTAKRPCAIMVDVNGDRKPNPTNVNCTGGGCVSSTYIKLLAPDSKYVNDIFTILITDEKAIPYGVLAQKAMYGAQK
ncbi:MAG: type II secretion system protein [bacterium]|nr:type II secretion system protein [bacterium]